MTVNGVYVCHSIRSGFLYAYACPECGRRHVSTAPELTAPTLCHRCFTGGQEELAKKRRRYQAGKAT